MATNNYTLVEEFCINCNVDYAFIKSLNESGLIEIIIVNDKKYISNEQLKELERTIHFHYELNINIEGIEVINHLLKQISELQNELNIARNKLSLYEF